MDQGLQKSISCMKRTGIRKLGMIAAEFERREMQFARYKGGEILMLFLPRQFPSLQLERVMSEMGGEQERTQAVPMKRSGRTPG